MTPLVNGKRHSWASIRVNVLGRTVEGISAISYSDKVEKANNYGVGNMPVSRGRGNYEAEATITLFAYEVDAIQKSIPGKRLDEIPAFDISVTYLAEGNDKIVNHVIRNCEFQSNKRDVKQNDTNIEIDLDLIVSHIEWSV